MFENRVLDAAGVRCRVLIDGWRTVARGLHLPYDERRRVHQQAAGFTRLQEWDFGGTPDDEYPGRLSRDELEILFARKTPSAYDILRARRSSTAFVVTLSAERKRNSSAQWTPACASQTHSSATLAPTTSGR